MAKPIVLESTATESVKNRIPLTIRNKLVYLANDSSTYPMKINFDASIEESGAFTLKAGEVLSDVEMDCTSISFQAVGAGATAAFRLMGV